MTKLLSRRRWVSVAGLTLCAALTLAADAPVSSANLLACKQGFTSCNRSQLTLAEVTQLGVSDHARYVSDCRRGYASCDRSQLSAPEAAALAVVDYDRNVASCIEGLGSCNPL